MAYECIMDFGGNDQECPSDPRLMSHCANENSHRDQTSELPLCPRNGHLEASKLCGFDQCQLCGLRPQHHKSKLKVRFGPPISLLIVPNWPMLQRVRGRLGDQCVSGCNEHQCPRCSCFRRIVRRGRRSGVGCNKSHPPRWPSCKRGEKRSWD